MSTPEDVFAWFEERLGNDGAESWNWYFGGGYIDGNVTPNCACTVSKAFHDTGTECEGFPRAVAIDRRDGFTRMLEPTEMRAGCAVGFDWDSDRRGDHVGVFKYYTDSEHFMSYEGNTSGGIIALKERSIYDVTCAVMPEYDGVPIEELPLDIDGACGPLTVRRWQTRMGMSPDGVISGQSHEHDKYRRNVWAVDYEGEGSRLMTLVGLFLLSKGYYLGPDGANGIWGAGYTDGIQMYLRDIGHYHGEIDHDFAHHSVEGLQMSLNDPEAWK